MRHYHSITPNVVHGRARQALRHVLDWTPFHKSVSVDNLLDLLGTVLIDTGAQRAFLGSLALVMMSRRKKTDMIAKTDRTTFACGKECQKNL